MLGGLIDILLGCVGGGGGKGLIVLLIWTLIGFGLLSTSVQKGSEKNENVYKIRRLLWFFCL